MSIAVTAPLADEGAERWKQWQLAYAKSSRRSETQVRILFLVVLSLVMSWLVFQI
jgi:hypothetical protein